MLVVSKQSSFTSVANLINWSIWFIIYYNHFFMKVACSSKNSQYSTAYFGIRKSLSTHFTSESTFILKYFFFEPSFFSPTFNILNLFYEFSDYFSATFSSFFVGFSVLVDFNFLINLVLKLSSFFSNYGFS